MKISEKRTQIYLPLNLFEPLKKEARMENKSIAQVVREAVGIYLADKTRKKVNWEKDPLHKLVGKGKGDADLSLHHDKYLYGDQPK